MVDVTDPADLLRQQEVLREFIESISSELELRPLLTRIVHHACELLGAGYGTIGLVDEGRNVVRTEAAYRMPPDELGAEMAPGVGLAGRVLQTRQPVILDRYGDVDNPTQPSLAAHAVIGMPIFWRGRVIGFFGIGAEPPRHFGPRDSEALAIFARHAAVAIENARRYEREQRRIERLALIARVGRIVTADLLLDDLLERTGAAIHDLLGYANVDVGLVSPEDPTTLVVVAVGGQFRKLSSHEVRIPLSSGVMGAAARERRVVLINDVRADPEYIPMPGAAGITSELAVPILLGDRVLGVLNVEADSPFDDEDAASLQIIADQLAGAIENARLFARVNASLQETRLLYDTSRRFNAAADVQDVVTAYLQQVAVRGRYVCSVALYEFDAAGERQAVVVRGRWTPQAGLHLAVERLPYTRDGLDPLLDAGQTVIIANVHTDLRVTEALRQMQQRSGRPALAMIPLMARGQRIGLVVLSHARIHDWPEPDLQPYQATAAQLAVAIDNARLFDGLREALDEARFLYEISRSVGAALDVDEAIEAYVEQVSGRHGVDCGVVLYEERTFDGATAAAGPAGGLVFYSAALRPGGPPEQQRFPYAPNGHQSRLDAGQTVLVADGREDENVPRDLRRMLALLGRPALAMIPLMARGRRIGFVMLSAPAGHAWPPAELRPLQAGAAQLAIGIDHRRQQRLLYERGQQVAVLEERQRLARELHDSVTQLIFSTALIAQSVGPAWRRDPAEGERRIGRLLDLSRSALAEMRALLFELRPPEGEPEAGPPSEPADDGPAVSGESIVPGVVRLQRDGLAAALRQHVAGLAVDGLTVDLDTVAYRPQAPAQEAALYRIAQEALNNVVKHSRASRAVLRLAVAGGQVSLTVDDDGVGFRPGDGNGRATASGGYGLRTMLERAAALGGSAEVKGAPGEGTTVRVVLPLPPEPGEGT